jgi:hypothetical protein
MMLLVFVMLCTPAKALPSPLDDVVSYADVDVTYQRGEVSINVIRKGRFTKPTRIPRWRGRFVAIVNAKKKSLAQVEFDFPLVAPAESPNDVSPENQKVADKLRSGITSSTTVRVPLPDGADAVSIWDSVTKKTVTAPLTSAK